MESKTFFKNLRERPFDAIKRGTKKIEIRANKKEPDNNSVNLMKSGDIIIFENESNKEKLKCVIERVTLYPTVKELLLKEGTKHTLSSTINIEEGIKSVESIGNYKEIIKNNGVFAIKIKDVKIID